MLKWVVAAALALAAVVLVPRFSVADNESDRESLKREIADKVNRIADELSGFDARRDADNADEALSYARDVSDLVSRLRDVMESDSDANAIVEKYPDYIESFREAMRYLKLLKQTQFLADGVADRCTRDEADLQTLIRNYVGHPDDADDAPSKLPSKGEEYGRMYAPLLDKLKDANSEFNSNASYARFGPSVSSSDPWSNVKDKYSDAAARMISYWQDRYPPIDAACKRLALGDKHPDIEHALADLRSYTGDVKQTVRQLKHDYNAWLADARKVREMTKQDHAELREVMCTKGVTEDDIKQKANAIADRWASQISSAYGTLLGQSDRLGERASSDKLKKYKGAKEVLDGLRANRATLEKIKSSDLQGSNNPRIKAKLEYGTNYHASWSCSGIKEFEIDKSYCDNPLRDGSSCRADCVALGSTCMVIELKPDNTDAESMGNKQKAAYEKGLHTWFEKNKDELLEKYPDVRQCIKDGQISTDSKLETYSFCPSDSEAQAFGESLDGLSSDVSESD